MMNETDHATTPEVRFSLRRVLPIIIPVVIAAAAVGWYAANMTSEAMRNRKEWTANRIGLNNPAKNRLLDKYADADGDLVADRPTAAECVTPEVLYFSYIPGDGAEQQADTWQGLMDSIAKETGLKVEFKPIKSVDDQLAAIAAGELHITGMNTGMVPKAVNVTGFVPRFVIGNDAGASGYTMEIIVPKESPLKKIEDLRGKRVTFTSTNSNSGFKAPVVMLMYDYGMKPGVDYEYGFSTSHDESIRLIAESQIAAATVASDMLERAIAAGTIQADAVRSIHSSEKFPTAAIGMAHNLTEEIAGKIEAAVSQHPLEGSSIQTALGIPANSQFVPVSYKDAWAIIRRTDDALGVIHATIESSSTAASN